MIYITINWCPFCDKEVFRSGLDGLIEIAGSNMACPVCGTNSEKTSLLQLESKPLKGRYDCKNVLDLLGKLIED